MWSHLRPAGPVAAPLLAWLLAIAQVLAGAGLMIPRTARVAACALCAVYLFFALATVPGIVRAPASYARYGDFFEQLAVACGAAGIFGGTALRRWSRIGFAACTISFALAQIVYLRFTASLVPRWLPPNGTFWAIATTVAFALAAVAVLIDRRAQLALRLTALMLALFGVLVWVPQVAAARPSVTADWSELIETLLIAASAWVLARST
ncbi:MAG TPA: hypothetical protein VGN14_15010 [Candidatus Elarobacter sp.]